MAIGGVVFGTCLLNGKHPPGSKLARECPVARAARRTTQAQKAAIARWRRPGASGEHDPGRGDGSMLGGG